MRILEADPIARKLRLTMREEGYEGPTGGGDLGGGGDRRGMKKVKSVEQFLNLSPDEWISGRVASITHFGAFVAVDDDTDGLLHISQIAEDHVSNVEDHLQVGQDVQVRVIEVDVDNCRLGLSMREPRQGGGRGGGSRGKKDVSVLLGRDPDEFIPGRVVSIVPYGAFVNIEGNIDGLVHISEMAVGRVDSVEDVCEVRLSICIFVNTLEFFYVWRKSKCYGEILVFNDDDTAVWGSLIQHLLSSVRPKRQCLLPSSPGLGKGARAATGLSLPVALVSHLLLRRYVCAL